MKGLEVEGSVFHSFTHEDEVQLQERDRDRSAFGGAEKIGKKGEEKNFVSRHYFLTVCLCMAFKTQKYQTTCHFRDCHTSGEVK